MHAHINGVEASAVWEPIASAYGVEKTLSMTRLEDVPLMRERFGDAIEFITIPDWHHADKRHGHGTDYLARIESYREQGAKIVKFWNAPASSTSDSRPATSTCSRSMARCVWSRCDWPSGWG